MALLGLGLVIASVSFLYYRHCPVGWLGWWGLVERVRYLGGIGRGIQDGGGGGRGDEMEGKRGGNGENEVNEMEEWEGGKAGRGGEGGYTGIVSVIEGGKEEDGVEGLSANANANALMSNNSKNETEEEEEWERERARREEKQIEEQIEMERERERREEMERQTKEQKKREEQIEKERQMEREKEKEKEENAKIEASTNVSSFHTTKSSKDMTTAKITEYLTIPPPNKAALDRAAMPPPPPFKKPAPPSKIPSANSSQSSKTSKTSNISPAGTSASTLFPTSTSTPEAKSDSQIPSFPAANSAQRASNGPRTGPRLNPLPNFTSSSLAPPSRGPLPNRSPLPNRNPPTSSSLAAPSLAPPPTHSSIPSKPRKKVLLRPNHSPLDWANLSASPLSNLRGLPPSTPLLRVPPSLLKKFTGRKGKDAWTVLGGKVYNITPYLPYHPGGEPELMKCAGRDGTRMFAEVHPWVNWEGMLEACLVGISVGEEEVEGSGELENMD